MLTTKEKVFIKQTLADMVKHGRIWEPAGKMDFYPNSNGKPVTVWVEWTNGFAVGFREGLPVSGVYVTWHDGRVDTFKRNSTVWVRV